MTADLTVVLHLSRFSYCRLPHLQILVGIGGRFMSLV